jgi:hypothetical protein
VTFDRRRWLIAHGADPVMWAKRWGIEPGSAPCYFCKAELSTTIPFAVGHLRGMMAPPCACGNANGPYCVVSADGRGILESLAPPPKPRAPRSKRAKKRKLRLVT